jgi:hypothetical protein
MPALDFLLHVHKNVFYHQVNSFFGISPLPLNPACVKQKSNKQLEERSLPGCLLRPSQIGKLTLGHLHNKITQMSDGEIRGCRTCRSLSASLTIRCFFACHIFMQI